MLKKLIISLSVVVLIQLGKNYLNIKSIKVKNIKIFVLFTVSSDRTKDKIYENINGHMCFRRLNSTHQTGCSCKKEVDKC